MKMRMASKRRLALVAARKKFKKLNEKERQINVHNDILRALCCADRIPPPPWALARTNFSSLTRREIEAELLSMCYRREIKSIRVETTIDGEKRVETTEIKEPNQWAVELVLSNRYPERWQKSSEASVTVNQVMVIPEDVLARARAMALAKQEAIETTATVVLDSRSTGSAH